MYTNLEKRRQTTRLRQRRWRAANPERLAWSSMWQRCTNSKNPRYKDYGGRGIGVSVDWGFFENFIRDIGPRPGPGYSIDRIDNSGHYIKGNVRWATAQQQCLNRRRPNACS